LHLRPRATPLNYRVAALSVCASSVLAFSVLPSGARSLAIQETPDRPDKRWRLDRLFLCKDFHREKAGKHFVSVELDVSSLFVAGLLRDGDQPHKGIVSMPERPDRSSRVSGCLAQSAFKRSAS
jgi:hypothetical protein